MTAQPWGMQAAISVLPWAETPRLSQQQRKCSAQGDTEKAVLPNKFRHTHTLLLSPASTTLFCSPRYIARQLVTSAATYPSMAVFLQRALTVPAAGSVLITSSTMLPSAHRMLLPGFTSCASFL